MTTLRQALGCMVTAAALTTGGCKTMPALPDAPAIERHPERRPARTLDNLVEQRKGEQGHGIIYHLGNVHHTDEMDKTSQKQVGSYQVRIWRALETLRPDAVFAEENAYGDGSIDKITMKESDIGTGAATTQTDKDINVYGALAAQARNLFPSGVPTQPSDKQLDWLGKNGAFVAYCATHPDVPLQAAMSWKEWQAIQADVENELAKNNNNVNARNAPVCFRGRESLAVKHINAYLAKHPDARVALVYGMRHEFGPALEESGSKSALFYWKAGPIITVPTNGKR